MQINLHYHNTTSNGDNEYVDLVSIDGVMQTQLMEKSAEPNFFVEKEIQLGNHFAEMVVAMKQRKSDRSVSVTVPSTQQTS